MRRSHPIRHKTVVRAACGHIVTIEAPDAYRLNALAEITARSGKCPVCIEGEDLNGNKGSSSKTS